MKEELELHRLKLEIWRLRLKLLALIGGILVSTLTAMRLLG
jgi:hypothetical protein